MNASTGSQVSPGLLTFLHVEHMETGPAVSVAAAASS